MTTKFGLLWLLALAVAAPIAAQTPPPVAATEEQTAPPPSEGATETPPAEEEEPLPDIDIWSEDAASEDDVFIPTERISADSNIAYPADI
jgi:hypothetical protein